MNDYNTFELKVPLENTSIEITYSRHHWNIDEEQGVKIDYPEFSGIILNIVNHLEVSINDYSAKLKPNQQQIICYSAAKLRISLLPGEHNFVTIRFPQNFTLTNPGSIFTELVNLVTAENSIAVSDPSSIPHQVNVILDKLRTYDRVDLQQTYFYCKIVEILVLLLEQTKNKNENITKDKFYATIHTASNLLRENIQKNWSLNLLADTVNISRKKLISGFKRYFGTSPIQYLYTERLNKALSFLRETTLPVSEIAVKVGYHHRQNFTQAFTKKFGQPPMAYRPQSDKQKIQNTTGNEKERNQFVPKSH